MKNVRQSEASEKERKKTQRRETIRNTANVKQTKKGAGRLEEKETKIHNTTVSSRQSTPVMHANPECLTGK